MASSENGFPMMRTLFFEYPDDPTSWMIEDEYFFGPDLLVAPLFEAAGHREVYLPPGIWIDYQSNIRYDGARWYDIQAGQIPIVVLVRNHAVIPHIGLTQSTQDLNWNEIELRVFSSDSGPAVGAFALPKGELQRLELHATPAGYSLTSDPLRGRVRWRITRPQVRTANR
jgi:alpha-D-xyloside xylohydrolase